MITELILCMRKEWLMIHPILTFHRKKRTENSKHSCEIRKYHRVHFRTRDHSVGGRERGVRGPLKATGCFGRSWGVLQSS